MPFVKILQRHALLVGVMDQSRMVLAQVSYLAQLVQPLLLLDIVPACVCIGGDGLREAPLEGNIGASEFGADGGLDGSSEVRTKEL